MFAARLVTGYRAKDKKGDVIDDPLHPIYEFMARVLDNPDIFSPFYSSDLVQIRSIPGHFHYFHVKGYNVDPTELETFMVSGSDEPPEGLFIVDVDFLQEIYHESPESFDVMLDFNPKLLEMIMERIL